MRAAAAFALCLVCAACGVSQRTLDAYRGNALKSDGAISPAEYVHGGDRMRATAAFASCLICAARGVSRRTLGAYRGDAPKSNGVISPGEYVGGGGPLGTVTIE